MTAGGGAVGGARDQVARLLTLVPYLHSRGEVRVEEAAAALGVSPGQVVKDLKVLFLCGLPGGYPDDLIDVDLDALEGPEADGVIRVSNADYLSRPLRLTATEATAVSVALLAVRGGAGAETREIVDRVLGKLQAASGASPEVAVATVGTGDPLATLRARLAAAVDARKQVRLTYWVPARDEETERVVDPRALVSVRGADYLDAWCHAAEDDRVFRLDRIHRAEVLDAPVTHQEPERDLAAGIFDFGADAEQATLRLAPAAGWVAEYYQVDDARPIEGGGLEVDLPVADRRWLERLALQLAPYAQVLAPASVQDAVAARARETLSLYERDDVQ